LSDEPIQMVEMPLARAQELRDKEKALEHLQRSADSPAHVIAEAIQELAENAHEHYWDILAVWSPIARPVPPRLVGNPNITIVLVRCQKCNLPTTLELAGIWTEEQVKKGLPDVV
jgi:hypothetical protein